MIETGWNSKFYYKFKTQDMHFCNLHTYVIYKKKKNMINDKGALTIKMKLEIPSVII